MDTIRSAVRAVVRSIAKILNRLSGGKITPAMVTYTSLLAHVLIAWLIATRHNVWAAGLLVVFGLFDVLDGELARLQGKASNAGMLLDASTDRMKETLLYIGAAYAMVATGHATWAVWAVAACGGSLIVSYVKAKGETAVAGKLPAHEVNRLFQDGLMRYEVRMAVLVAGLLINRVILAVVIIAASAWFTAFQRLMKISQSLHNVQD